ncbi:MAG: HTH domain-containing protein [Candidatus Jordarchaeales archaeon]|nr:HTH domain-containing protein [Candidatus Jordarchaeia archaeon]
MTGLWETRREKILRLLKESDTPLSAEQISLLLELDRKDVYDDLKHIARSLQKSEWQLVMVPPRCLKCGYVFSSDKPKKPSRCPKCRGERVSDPLFKVVSR